tara:strand:+ start:5340 stop:5507 length:168 start_codon:yes stop_codon:yes gene_type:complete
MSNTKKDSTLLIKVNREEKNTFIKLCEDQDTTASREIRKFIRLYTQGHEKNKKSV